MHNIFTNKEVNAAIMGFNKDFPIVGWDTMVENETCCIFTFKNKEVGYLKCRLKINFTQSVGN